MTPTFDDTDIDTDTNTDASTFASLRSYCLQVVQMAQQEVESYRTNPGQYFLPPHGISSYFPPNWSLVWTEACNQPFLSHLVDDVLPALLCLPTAAFAPPELVSQLHRAVVDSLAPAISSFACLFPSKALSSEPSTIVESRHPYENVCSLFLLGGLINLGWDLRY